MLDPQFFFVSIERPGAIQQFVKNDTQAVNVRPVINLLRASGGKLLRTSIGGSSPANREDGLQPNRV
jgi:hypothetical protein